MIVTALTLLCCLGINGQQAHRILEDMTYVHRIKAQNNQEKIVQDSITNPINTFATISGTPAGPRFGLDCLRDFGYAVCVSNY